MHASSRSSIAMLCFFFALASKAQESRDFAVMGRVAWSAFECSSLAAQMKDRKEQERLFLLGYEHGKTFIEAVQTKKVDRKDISEEVPIGMMLLLQGPTPDFMLGRVYESAQENALKDVMRSDGKLNSDEVQALIAQRGYTSRNCRLLRAIK